MTTLAKGFQLVIMIVVTIIYTFFVVGCASESIQNETNEPHEHTDNLEQSPSDTMLSLPELEPIQLNGNPLKVVATTSIIGDVVAQIGGEVIDLTVLMQPGQDPHSYEPAAQDLTAVADAQLIFINGWDLEETLVRDLEEIGKNASLVTISANIDPLILNGDDNIDHAEDEDHAHENRGPDPHVWFSTHNIAQWTENVDQVLSSLDPANSETYTNNATAYLAELEALTEYAAAQTANIPQENRFLVTNHDALGYFADQFGFTILGTVIPGLSTLAEPSASDLAGLIEEMEAHDTCTIFTETIAGDSLGQTVTAELKNCDKVNVVELYTDAIGPVGSNADSIIGMFQANVDKIVAGLQD